MGMGMGMGWRRRAVRGLLSLAVALSDVLYSFFAVLKTVVFVLLCLLGILSASHKGVTPLLDGSLKACHLPFPARRELAGVGL
jgi:hypothetical protein